MQPCRNPKYLHEPTTLQCGQAVLAMLTGKSVGEIISITGTDKETDLKQMKKCLEYFGIEFEDERKPCTELSDLPDICILSLETPHCWHWSLYVYGKFYDPEYGILNSFPPSKRRYYWKINE